MNISTIRSDLVDIAMMTTTAGFAARLAVLALLVAATAMAHGQSATQRVSPDGDSGKMTLVFRNASFSSVAPSNVTYRSSTGYNAKGMAPLYKIANQVIGLFVGKTVLPDGKWDIYGIGRKRGFICGTCAAVHSVSVCLCAIRIAHVSYQNGAGAIKCNCAEPQRETVRANGVLSAHSPVKQKYFMLYA